MRQSGTSPPPARQTAMRQCAESALAACRVSTGETVKHRRLTGRRPGNTHQHRSKSIRSRHNRDHADHHARPIIGSRPNMNGRISESPAIPPSREDTDRQPHDHTEKEITQYNRGQDQAPGFNQGRNGVDEYLHFEVKSPIPKHRDFNIFALLERNAELIFQPALDIVFGAVRNGDRTAESGLASPPTYIGYLPRRFAEISAKSGRAWISAKAAT